MRFPYFLARSFATTTLPKTIREKFLAGAVNGEEMRRIAQENAKIGCDESRSFLAALDTRDPGLRVETGITDPKKLANVATALAADAGSKPYQNFFPTHLHGEAENYKELLPHNDFPGHEVSVVTLACAKGAGVVETLVISAEEIAKALSPFALESLASRNYVDAVNKRLLPYAVFSCDEKGKRAINFSADTRCAKGASAGCFEALNELRGVLGIEPLKHSSTFGKVMEKFFAAKKPVLQVVAESHRLKDGDVLRIKNSESLHARRDTRTAEGKTADPARDVELRAFTPLKPADSRIIE